MFGKKKKVTYTLGECLQMLQKLPESGLIRGVHSVGLMDPLSKIDEPVEYVTCVYKTDVKTAVGAKALADGFIVTQVHKSGNKFVVVADKK